MGYVTRHFRRQPDHIPGLSGIVLLATPPDRRMAVLLAQDGNRWVVTIGGYLGEHAPSDSAGFTAAARALPAPEIHDVIANAEALDEAVPYKFPSNLRRHYEKLVRFPAGFLVIGDALCSFNPIYGQGMTVAALSAVALGEEIARAGGRLDGVAARAERAFGKVTEGAWLLATGADLEWPETVGGESSNSLADRFGRWYIDKLLDAVGRDEQVRMAFNEVSQLVKPATSLFAPSIMARVLLRR